MYNDAREFIDCLGGYRKVAALLGMKATTLHTHMQSGILPAKWFKASCELARLNGVKEPQQDMFGFENLPDVREDAA